MGFGCARFATLTIAPPHPKGAKQQGKKAIYRKKFTPAGDAFSGVQSQVKPAIYFADSNDYITP